jgi:hypothetical protein
MVNMSIFTMCLFLEAKAFSFGSSLRNRGLAIIGKIKGTIVRLILPAYSIITPCGLDGSETRGLLKVHW